MADVISHLEAVREDVRQRLSIDIEKKVYWNIAQVESFLINSGK